MIRQGGWTMFNIKPISLLAAIASTLLICSVGRAQYASPIEYISEPVVPLDSSTNPVLATSTEEFQHDATNVSGILTPEQEFAQLRARLDILESAEEKRKKDAAKKNSDDEQKEEKPYWTDVSKEKWTVKFGGHVQSDFVSWAHADPSIPNAQNYFEFRRLRLVADGTGYGNLDFRLQMTLEPETVGESPVGTVISPDVKDAYLTMNEIPLIGRLRFGNFFVPFGLEQVTNDAYNIFLERSIPTQGIFTADREVGLAAYNCTDDERLSWSTGFFIDSVSEGLKEKIDDNQGYRLSGRLNYIPYYDETTNGRYLWHTGAGVLYTDDGDNRVRCRARPQIHEGPRLIDSGVIDATDYTTANVENAFVMGRFTLQTESYISSVNRTNGDTPTVDGSYAHVSYFLTGESRTYEKFGQHGAQFGRNVPYSNFFVTPGGISWGAIELKARWSHLDLKELNAGIYNDMTYGFNWYWSDRIRYMFDWIHPFTTSQTVVGAAQADIIGMRFDFNW
jgi:phosphate-selective porin OprO/OprP